MGQKEAGDQNIYQSIGVEPIINCRGTFTIIGGSVERPEVLEAMDAASGYFVQYDELAEAVGKRLAEITGAEWGLISAGCAAGMKHITAACVTGGNPEKLIRIPDLTGMDKTQVIAPRYSRNAYDHAVRNIGVEMVMVETPEELEMAINPKTAMIYLTAGGGSATGQPLSLEVIAEIARPKKIPIMIDAAAEDLTIPNVHLERGANVVTYSGGKALCGPQCAGLVLGDKDLLMSAWQASAPHHGPGRDDKIGKEEIMGMLAAVEAWVTRDHKAEWQVWLSYLDLIATRVESIGGVTTRVEEPRGLSNHAPALRISWDPSALHITGEEVAEDFARKTPRIAVGSGGEDGLTSINITPNQMQPGNAEVVAERVYQILSEERSPKSTELAPAGADIDGHWDVTVEFFSGTGRHQLFLQQDGNWIEGTHESDFSSQGIAGTIEANEVKLRSEMRRPGNGITFIFSGKIEGGTISGTVFLGEYLKATFTAEKSSLKGVRRMVAIPGGQPLAT
ncbi:MAG: aminotransferase class V-fold PLP-dependent enzyme [Gemmatimonadetes bacterium]|jgi:D-glucosaminate-6-phosphate ammonia-lyase|nr:aminotransferase class V-fold PLP-dependent enzyme [Gemmatimonadota bacterium]